MTKMKFKYGDKVTAEVMGKQRNAVVVYTYPETNEYQVSVENGAGGFHIVSEDKLIAREEK